MRTSTLRQSLRIIAVLVVLGIAVFPLYWMFVTSLTSDSDLFSRSLNLLPDLGTPVGVNLAPLVSKEVTLKGCFRFHDEIDEAITLLGEDPTIASIITHVVSVEDVERAFNLARDSQSSGKVVVSLWLDD